MSSKEDQVYALGQFASHISVFSASAVVRAAEVNNQTDQEPCAAAPSATKEEAQLLMNLLSPVSRRNGESSLRDAFSPPGVGSSGDAGDHCYGTVFRRFDRLDSDPFSFACPSLSLACDRFCKSSSLNHHHHRAVVSPSAADRSRKKNVVSPPHSGSGNNDSEYHRLHDSPVVACEDRRNQYQQPSALGELLDRQLSENTNWGDVDVVAENLTENVRDTFEYVVNSRIQTWQASLSNVLQLRGERLDDDEEGNDARVVGDDDSKELKVFKSLSRACSKLYVSKVSTAFRTLREESSSAHHRDHHFERPEDVDLSLSPGNNQSSTVSHIVTPLPKKKLRRTGSISQRDEDDGFDPSVMRRPLEFTVTMDVAPYDLTLFLHAPGYITGIFDMESRERELTGTDITLDMDRLVDSIRKQSRHVARKAAEVELRTITANVVAPPRVADEEDVAADDATMPPPPPRTASGRARPGIVSPTPGSPSGVGAVSASGRETNGEFPSSPFLSPRAGRDDDEGVTAEEGEDSSSISVGPSLPALVEVACASFAAEKETTSKTN